LGFGGDGGAFAAGFPPPIVEAGVLEAEGACPILWLLVFLVGSIPVPFSLLLKAASRFSSSLAYSEYLVVFDTGGYPVEFDEGLRDCEIADDEAEERFTPPLPRLGGKLCVGVTDFAVE